MGETITQIGIGGVLALVIIREVLNFLKGHGKNSKMNDTISLKL